MKIILLFKYHIDCLFLSLKIDFLKKCLDKDPNHRWTCDQLLQHAYFENFNFQMPEGEMEEFEKLQKKYRERSRVLICQYNH